jgi:excisionase family DNA binding protein
MTHPAHGRLLTSTQAGQLLRVSGRTVLRMTERGELSYVQKMPGSRGQFLYDAEVVQAKALELVVGHESDQQELELEVPARRAS